MMRPEWLTLMAVKRYATCKGVSRLMSEAQERKLSWHRRLPLNMHLYFCEGCRNFRDQLEFLRVAVRRHRDRP